MHGDALDGRRLLADLSPCERKTLECADANNTGTDNPFGRSPTGHDWNRANTPTGRKVRLSGASAHTNHRRFRAPNYPLTHFIGDPAQSGPANSRAGADRGGECDPGRRWDQ